jgi:phosphoglycolate phosphatase-like HAD superfamily hydrolase
VDAVRDVTGLETTTENIPVHGMLDRDILRQMMLDAGAGDDRIRAAMPEIVERAQERYVLSCPDLQDKTCPGARELLQQLTSAGVPLLLVTGNLTRIGWRKMERAGLQKYFRFGAFSEMAKDRAGLAALAIGHARENGWVRNGTPISLIGDAPSDIIAARANGARAIAVQTGISTLEELQFESPDLLVEDLRALHLADFL